MNLKNNIFFIGSIATVTTFTAGSTGEILKKQETSLPQKPNILWVTIEDTSPQFIGCYGNEDASTPFIDRLAKEGVRFTNAFSTGTVCSPSRSCIITGVKTYKTGMGNLGLVPNNTEYKE